MIYSTGKTYTLDVPTSKASRSAFVLRRIRRLLTLARWAVTIEKHYGCPNGLEWAKDGETGEISSLFQARPGCPVAKR